MNREEDTLVDIRNNLLSKKHKREILLKFCNDNYIHKGKTGTKSLIVSKLMRNKKMLEKYVGKNIYLNHIETKTDVTDHIIKTDGLGLYEEIMRCLQFGKLRRVNDRIYGKFSLLSYNYYFKDYKSTIKQKKFEDMNSVYYEKIISTNIKFGSSLNADFRTPNLIEKEFWWVKNGETDDIYQLINGIDTLLYKGEKERIYITNLKITNEIEKLTLNKVEKNIVKVRRTIKEKNSINEEIQIKENDNIKITPINKTIQVNDQTNKVEEIKITNENFENRVDNLETKPTKKVVIKRKTVVQENIDKV
jgi:hypothetical protein